MNLDSLYKVDLIKVGISGVHGSFLYVVDPYLSDPILRNTFPLAKILLVMLPNPISI